MDVLDSKWNCAICIDSRQGGREENQDSYACADTPLGFVAVVCDGMGGGPGGANASTLAVQAIVQHLKDSIPDADPSAALSNAVQAANSLLRQVVSEHGELAGMGTTCVVALVKGRTAVVAHVGDSRLYHVRAGRLLFRTDDHSVVAEMVRRGELTDEDARRAANSNVITRALGIADVVSVDIDSLSLSVGDRLMLCTDGVWGAMPEERLVPMMVVHRNLKDVVRQTMDAVEAVGHTKSGYDNLTLGIVLVSGVSDSTSSNVTPVGVTVVGSKVLAVVLCLLLVVSVAANIYLLSTRASSGGSVGKPFIGVQQANDVSSNQHNTVGKVAENVGKSDAIDKELEYQFLKSDNRQKQDTISILKQQLEEVLSSPRNKAKTIDRMVHNLNKMNSQSMRSKDKRQEREKCVEQIKQDIKELQDEHKRDENVLKNINMHFSEFSSKCVDNPSSSSSKIIDEMVKQLNSMR